jgi:hypothetical protein
MTPTRAAVLAALVAALGLTAMSPAFAAGPDRPRDDSRTLEFRRDGAGGAFRFAEFSCNDRAADRLERGLDRMAGKLALTSDQEKLFEDFRTSALTAQTAFADQCDTIRPDVAASKTERPDLIQRLEQRLKVDEARLAAMSELLPQFKSFYASLTDAQKSELAPRARMKMKGFQHPGLPHHPAGPAATGSDG